MGEKNKGRPKRHGDRPFRPLGDRDQSRPQQKKSRGDGKPREGAGRADAFQGDKPRAGKPRGAGFRGGDRREAPGDRYTQRGQANRDDFKQGRPPFPQRRGPKPDRDRTDGEHEAGGHEGRRGRRFEPRSASRAERVADTENAPAHSEKRDGKPHQQERLWIYGRHAAIAAIANPQRQIKRILVSDSALEWINDLRAPRERLAQMVKAPPAHIDAALHHGAVHQGIAVEVEDLPRARLKEDCLPDGLRPVVVLDQITDPHNIGAIFRSAAAFNARAIVVQDRRTPPLAGALAKAAAGAVEAVPCVQAVNIARSLEGLKALGYFCAGLAGDSGAPIATLPKDRPIALVLGAEGAGLRKLVRDTCDRIYAIPMARGVDSLNVSNASAVALYEIARR